MYKFPRISSGLDSTGGTGGADGPAAGKTLAEVSAAATERNAGATIFFDEGAGIAGFTAELARIAEVFSRLATAGSGVFSLTVTSAAGSEPAVAPESVSGSAFVAGFAGADF